MMDETPSKLSPDYVTRRELCRLLGVSRQTTHNWQLEPDNVIGNTGVWWRSSVDRIAEEHGIDLDD